MLAITEQTILLIRAGQRRHDTNRFNERMDRPKPRTRQLNQDRRRHLIEGTAYLLKTGQPTRFAFEGACPHWMATGRSSPVPNSTAKSAIGALMYFWIPSVEPASRPSNAA